MAESFGVSQALTALQIQRDTVKHIRTQAAVVASFSLLIFRFMSTKNVENETILLEVWDFPAAFFFLVSIVFSLGAALLRPKWYYTVTLEQAQYFDRMEDDGKCERDIEDVKQQMLFRMVDENDRELALANTSLTIAMLSTGLQPIFWLQ